MTSAQPAQEPLFRSDIRRLRGLFKELIYLQLIKGILIFFSVKTSNILKRSIHLLSLNKRHSSTSWYYLPHETYLAAQVKLRCLCFKYHLHFSKIKQLKYKTWPLETCVDIWTIRASNSSNTKNSCFHNQHIRFFRN